MADAKTVYHVSKRKEDGMWQVKFANGERALKLFKTQAEAIEFEAASDLEFLGKKISEINLKKDIVIAFIIRNKKVIIPHGETTIEENDKVMIIASADKNIGRLSEIVE